MKPFAHATLLLCSLSLVAAGCADTPAEMAAASRLDPVAAAAVDVPPKQLVERIKQVVAAPPLSLGVEAQERGMIQTGWKRYEGDMHIARRWQERTRYRIEVLPDWDEPTGKSKVHVIAETEQRATEGQDWDHEPRVLRPQRAQEILDQIVQQVRAQQPAQK
jgi:hypothetical protein